MILIKLFKVIVRRQLVPFTLSQFLEFNQLKFDRNCFKIMFTLSKYASSILIELGLCLCGRKRENQ